MMATFQQLPRTVLFGLEPADAGDGYMFESVGSYLVRLAYAHRKAPHHFLRHFLNPVLGQGQVSNDLFISYGFSAMNGYRPKAEVYVSALAVFTGQRGVELLSMSPWKTLLDSMGKGLFHSSKKWCPECLYQWRSAGEVLYEPLFWSLQSLEACPIHQCTLKSSCSDCGARQYMVQRVLPVGYCPECGSFLGEPSGEDDRQALSQKELYLLDLVASRHLVIEGVSLQQLLRDGIRVVMSRLGVTSTKKLEQLLSFSKATISQWFSDGKRGTRPTLSTLLNFCVAVQVSPADLLFHHKRIDPDAKIAELDGRQSYDNADKLDWVECQLTKIVNDHSEIISVNQVAEQLKVGVSYLRYHFPEKTAELVAKNNELRAKQRKARNKRKISLVEEACQHLLDGGVFPSHNYVRAALKNELKNFGFGEFTEIWREVTEKL
ncbi:TniQ family protein [Endozoicomonas sp. ALB091]|uniref:TniQ family protein n=1 Tax=Endozoicomonas sp. ALB091 TaxID=3403073 RepID=UPI003BB51472